MNNMGNYNENNMPWGYELDQNVMYTGCDLICGETVIQSGDNLKSVIIKMFEKICELEAEITNLKNNDNV